MARHLADVPRQAIVWAANSPGTLGISSIILVLSSAGLYALFEHKSYGEALWWAVVTASTVGYGDTYPETWQGRLVATALIAVMVLFIVPMITAQFASKLIVDRDAFRHEEQEEIKVNLRETRRLLEQLARTTESGPGAVTEASDSDRRSAD